MCSNWCYTKRPGTMCIQKSSWHVNFPSNYTIKPMTRNIQQKRRSGVGVSNGPDSGSKFYEWTDSGGQVFKTVRQKKKHFSFKAYPYSFGCFASMLKIQLFLKFLPKKMGGQKQLCVTSHSTLQNFKHPLSSSPLLKLIKHTYIFLQSWRWGIGRGLTSGIA